MRVVHAMIGVLFLLGAIVQLNDPDPARWVVLYASACALAALSAAGHALRNLMAPILLLFSVLGSFLIFRNGLETISFAALFGDIEMKTPSVEAWRELLGLLLIGGYSLLVSWSSFRNLR